MWLGKGNSVEKASIQHLDSLQRDSTSASEAVLPVLPGRAWISLCAKSEFPVDVHPECSSLLGARVEPGNVLNLS